MKNPPVIYTGSVINRRKFEKKIDSMGFVCYSNVAIIQRLLL
jgi:hypothetical protein